MPGAGSELWVVGAVASCTAGAPGATVSMVHVRVATAPVLPAASVARTRSACWPSSEAAQSHRRGAGGPGGVVEGALEGTARSSADSVKCAVAVPVTAAGPPVNAPTGLVVSTVQARVASAPTFPAGSTARTWST